MSRRPRRSGIKFIENEKDRHLTYFKRRSGLNKSSADQSTLTGGKSVIALESESGKKSAFGTPSANAIIDSFLSEHSPYNDEGETAKIIHLQDELFRLEKGKVVDYKRERESKTLLKAIQDTSCDVEDLGVNEVSDLFQSLGLVQEDINNWANPGTQSDVRAQSGPLLPLYSPSCHSQIKVPPRRLPWVPLEASSQHPRLSWPQSYFLDPILDHEKNMIPPLPNEAHQYNYYFPQPQPLMLPLQGELSLNPTAPANPNLAYTNNFTFNPVDPPYQNHTYTQNSNINPLAQPGQEHAHTQSFNFNLGVPSDENANSHNFPAGQPPIGYPWPPVTPYNEIDYDPSLDPLSDYFGLADDYGGQAAADGHDDELDPSDLQAQADDARFTMSLFDSPFHGETFGDGA